MRLILPGIAAFYLGTKLQFLFQVTTLFSCLFWKLFWVSSTAWKIFRQYYWPGKQLFTVLGTACKVLLFWLKKLRISWFNLFITGPTFGLLNMKTENASRQLKSLIGHSQGWKIPFNIRFCTCLINSAVYCENLNKVHFRRSQYFVPKAL